MLRAKRKYALPIAFSLLHYIPGSLQITENTEGITYQRALVAIEKGREV